MASILVASILLSLLSQGLLAEGVQATDLHNTVNAEIANSETELQTCVEKRAPNLCIGLARRTTELDGKANRDVSTLLRKAKTQSLQVQDWNSAISFSDDILWNALTRQDYASLAAEDSWQLDHREHLGSPHKISYALMARGIALEYLYLGSDPTEEIIAFIGTEQKTNKSGAIAL